MTARGEGTAGPARNALPWWERWGDRLNPLVVKEVRQGLRSRVFWVCFGLMLLACFIISVTAFVSTRDGGLGTQGQGYFFAFFFCLGAVHFFVIPYSAYRSLSREREDETWVLLVLTGLGPRRILRGKVTSYLVQAGLYASAAGPFLLFSYYLNGIDLPTILGVLVLAAAWLVFLTVVAVCAATLADGRMGRALVHFLLLGALGLSFLYALLAAYFLSEQGYRLATRDNALFMVLGGALWMMLSTAWLFFETAAARLSLLTENYSRGPRLALGVQTVLSAALACGLVWGQGASSPGLAERMSVAGCLYLTVAGLFVVSDHDGQARALRAGTRPWSLLRPGALRGFRFVVLLLLGWSVACLALHPPPRLGPELIGVLAPSLYGILYLSLPLLVGRMPRSNWLAAPSVIRLLFVALVGLGGLVPPLFAVLCDQPGDDPLINLLSPFVGLGHFVERSQSDEFDQLSVEVKMGLLLCVGLVALLAAFATDRVLAEREHRAHTA